MNKCRVELIKEINDLGVSLYSETKVLSENLLSLASEMYQNGLGKYAVRIEEQVVNSLLDAPYDFRKAFFSHKTLFSERHKMAMFIYDNLALIKDNVNKKAELIKQVESGKIKVFTYWDNDDNLPPIIALCRESLHKYIDKDRFELILLNKSNYTEWVCLSQEYIKEDISLAHFSDILRIKILEKWGGFWLDATCLLTKDFYSETQNIRQQDQFFFTYIISRTGSWFIWSKPNNYIISMVSEILSLWWKEKMHITNYFMFHDIVEMLYWIDPEYRKNWDSMQLIHPRNALALLKDYHNDISQDKMNKLLEDSFVHKLTYKYDKSKVVPNSVLSRLLLR